MTAPVAVTPLAPGPTLAIVTQTLLSRLPGWFGIPESNREYVDAARRLPGWLASMDGRSCGVLLLERRYDVAAEIHLIAVDPELHARGIGTRMLERAEAALRSEGRTLLQVKTLGPSRPHAGYVATRAFYLARGFEPLEEIVGLWPGNPCLLMVKVL